MLIDDYFVHQINFEIKYGSKTLVLMQVGSFFEFYGVNNKEEKIGDLLTITELLNIQLTRRNKAVLENSRSNCLMAGFPLVSLKRFINILLSNNYTVILIEQVSEPPNPKREITQIYSPGTYIEEINQSDPNHIVSIYVVEETCYKTSKICYSFGSSVIDLSTGNNFIYEVSVLYYEKSAFLEEIYRFIESYNPKEIIIHYSEFDIRSKINFNNRIVHYRDSIDSKFLNINYQNSFLAKIFPNHGILSPIEYIDMEKKRYATISYIILLQFAFEHNERVIENIKKPVQWEYDNHLILYHNTIYQLNIISHNKNESLYDVIQKTSTNMGKRLLKHRIMNPIIDVDELNKRYQLIDLFLESDMINTTEKILNEIVDIERLHRKMVLQMLHPYEFLNLSYSYENIKNLIHVVQNECPKIMEIMGYGYGSGSGPGQNDIFDKFFDFMKMYEDIFDMLEMGKYGLANISNSFFKVGYDKEIDNIQIKINSINKFFQEECSHLSNLIEMGSDYVKLENNDREGYFLYTTKKRSDVLVTKLSKTEIYEIKKYNATNIKIVSDKITSYSNELIECREKIKILTRDRYLAVLLDFSGKFVSEVLDKICHFVAIIDIIKCGAKCAKMYKYCRPTIVNTYNKKSYFSAKEIRHPIIEIINEKNDYVTNNLELIHEETNGILLYGVNGSGKSSLSKAVGSNIILAQIGFFVASKEFVYYPYNKIFTRINGDDNIFKGMSSFAVEMDELRSILKYSDDRSIVLGDEICKGTEETSALAIVSASIIRFCKNNVNFIMATHFHKLSELDVIKNINNIKFKHLSIDYDKDNHNIIYGRKLMDGTGSNLYGIEIADFIIEDSDFIESAKRIRTTILNKSEEFLVSKTSNYNSKLYIDKCTICGDNGFLYPLDTHHIKEQNTFSEGDVHKDKLSNLVVLCKTHHDEVHNGNLEIMGYLDTAAGQKIDYKISDEDVISSKKKKYNSHQISIIKQMAIQFKEQKQFMKVLIAELKKQDINISAKTIQKICTDTYF